jgi:large-conductance mechanosensitive channel
MSENNKLKNYLIIGALFFFVIKVLDAISNKKEKE